FRYSKICTIEKRGRVFFLTLTRDGERRLFPDVIDAIQSAPAYAKTDYYSCGRQGRALVIIADGRFFSNGFNIAWSKAVNSPGASQERLISMSSLFINLITDLLFASRAEDAKRNHDRDLGREGALWQGGAGKVLKTGKLLEKADHGRDPTGLFPLREAAAIKPLPQIGAIRGRTPRRAKKFLPNGPLINP
ncbi:uncharacterized protein LOC110037449, partial [Phalaenopsis equestris]|uniref:uncharacterized protein LOC110037449 n=1 Tax=Phalaenopsis equestris TaxID=78828 RepID=UPI0009E5C0D2